MSSQSLKGKKIAVLVESQYIVDEIAQYRDRFEEEGAEVHFLANLNGSPFVNLVSEVEEVGHTPKLLTVTRDIRKAAPEDYAAILVAANYPSVRLRHFVPPDGPDGKPLPIHPEMVRTSPAVQFLSRAMRHPEIVKGALCHALWLLTPTPELLAGRKVICHEVVLADVLNAGGVYTPHPSGVVVDGDLVTGRSYLNVSEFIQRIKGLLVPQQPVVAPAPQGSAPPQPGTGRQRSILVVLSNHGYWGEELVGPLEVFERQGYRVEFATPNGQRPVALPPSMDSGYIDPPLGRSVTSPRMALKVCLLDATGPGRSERSRMLDAPLNLSELLPERPYFSHPMMVRALEAYYRERDEALRAFERFDALLLVGGSGPIVDLANNQRVHDLILGFLRLGKPIAAECYAVTCLAFARELEDRRSILRNKHVTGHCLEYDYKDGTGFVGTDFNMGPPPYPLEYILRDATAPEGQYHGNFGKEQSVIVDYPFVTGRSTPDSTLTGEKLVEVLEQGLRRWGF
ncbi:thiamine biosynthesis protein ThiJ [Corallococcus sp. CA053C]|uniref:DJ-1/PfpI family protein n=1 Tax=Corallococcus sp. CA053C TaxID=2316732 RepID=UPI000EA13DBC|nr:DJ-1/PfpI family protein [Corallococcus sp. CA053C]RKG94497.1 thiamine biosynthesis protein ThiJ [Corallococcus sp. CA053C]